MILVLLLALAVQTHGRSDWVDPFSITDENAVVVQECRQVLSGGCDRDTEALLVHYQRTLRLLLNTMTYDPASLQYTAKLTPSISVADYDFLNEFSSLIREDADGWKKLDDVLSKVFHRSFSDKMYESILGWTEVMAVYLQSVETLACLAFVFVGLVVYRTVSLGWLLKRFVFLILVGGYCLTWVELVQVKEIEKLMKASQQIPKECDPKGMSMFDYIFYSLGYNKDACTDYYKQTYTKSIWLVNPVVVLGEMLGLLVKTPSGHFGEAFGYFTLSILKGMPWYMCWLLPVVLIFALMIICILLSFCTNTPVRFNFLYVLQFDFGGNRTQQLSDYLPTLRYLKAENDSTEQTKTSRENLEESLLSGVEDVKESKEMETTRKKEMITEKEEEPTENKTEVNKPTKEETINEGCD